MNRTIDANINRVCEGLRVVEDILRFEYDFEDHIDDLKKMRHFLREEFSTEFLKIGDRARNSVGDTGKKFSETENNRSSVKDLLKANLYRVEEGLRVLEEAVKLNESLVIYSPKMKELRYAVYDIETKIMKIVE